MFRRVEIRFYPTKKSSRRHPLRFRGTVLSDYEQEPSIEMGKDSAFKHWGRALIAVIIAGIVIGFVASVSYVQYPYEVGVEGTYESSNGGLALYIATAACDAWLYQQCPVPGEYAVYQCWAPPVMNMGNYCVTYDTQTNLGHYEEDFRNGESYYVTGYMVYRNGTFDKVCFNTISLIPQTGQHNSTKDLTC
jgi:hypothetical protein